MKRLILNLFVLSWTAVLACAQSGNLPYEALIRATYLTELQAYDSALNVLDSIEASGSMDPSNLIIPQSKLKIYKRQGDCKSAIQMLHLLTVRINRLDRNPANSFPESLLVDFRDNYRCLGNKDSAVQFGMLLVKTKPKDAAHSVELARIFEEYGDAELALQVLNKIDVLDDYAPLDAVIVKAKVLVALDSAQAGAALLESQMGWEQYKNDREANLVMGNAYKKLGENAKACTYYTAVAHMAVKNVKMHPNNGWYQATKLLKERMEFEQNRGAVCNP